MRPSSYMDVGMCSASANNKEESEQTRRGYRTSACLDIVIEGLVVE
jgi:hypothetical protein